MKAMVLAAGLGTRLRPLTNDIPKCLMPLAGRPLIDWTLRWIRHGGVEECVINLHYLPEKVKTFVGNGQQYDLNVHYSYEPELLGTAGAVKKVAAFFDEPFYVIYSDNFSLWELRKLKQFYDTVSSVNNNIGTEVAAVIAVHWREDVTSSGMVEISEDNQVINYMEKPKKEDVTSNYVNAGFYYLNPKILDYIADNRFFDFSYHVFPAIIKNGEKLYAVKMDMPIIGIDTLDAYNSADKLAEQYKVKSKETGLGL
ncbi:MAG: nucleotidyltransferase family protein [Pseudomonadota bacterium]